MLTFNCGDGVVLPIEKTDNLDSTDKFTNGFKITIERMQKAKNLSTPSFTDYDP